MEPDIAGRANSAPVHKPAQKQAPHFRIGEMAREFDVTLRALRFYEDKGLLHPKRKGLTRLYSDRDRERLKLILRGRKIGFTLRDMKQILDVYGSERATAQQLRVFLDVARKQMEWLEQRHRETEEAARELSAMIRDVRDRISRAA